jgi:hypothetical protein
MNQFLPSREGFYWAKWKIAASGTDACCKCGHEHSSWERDGGPDEWEVVRVVENTLDAAHPEHLMVEVPGVSCWQSIEDFFWGSGPLVVPR